MIKKILKISLIIIALACLAGLDIWFVWSKQYPLWVAGAIFAGIIGIFVGILFLRKYLLRRREKKFVQKVVQLDESVIKGAPLHERRELQDLQDNWKQSVSLLRSSALKKHGNPLYALPWYLVIGESGSGKTTAIRNSRLESPVAYPDKASTISATINCDWWFFQNAVVLDTAGRYTIPLDEIPDKEEWEKFLGLLAKYRRREPINGIIATIAADKVLSVNKNVLREDGQNIRKRIDQLMRTLGARFPVYILVTKMDRVYGFNDIFGLLHPEELGQAMGYINNDTRSHYDMFLDEAFESVSDRARHLAFNAVREKSAFKAGTLVFREELMRLRPGLIEFMRSVFGDNPYQETPLLRGVFFSSGRQDGTPPSEFLEAAHVIPEGADAPPVEKGIFLRDIFSRILPGDRSLYTHTHDFLRWRRMTRSLGFTSWLFVWAALIGLLTFSFVHNVTTLKNFTDVFHRLPAMPGDAASNLLTIEKYRIEIEQLSKSNGRRFLPTFGLNQSRQAEERAKEHYTSFVNQGFLWGFDKSFSAKLDAVNADTDPDTLSVYANYLALRLALLSSYLDTGKMPDAKDFGEAAAAAIDSNYDNLPYEASQIFGNVYRDYILWHNNRAELMRNRELLEAGLNTLVTRHGNLEWLVHKSIPGAPDVRLAEFWGSPEVGEHDDSVFVPGAYTKLGQKHIAAFVAQLEKVMKRGTTFTAKVPRFWKWYQEEYYKSWYNFAENFNKGAEAFQTEAAQRNMAALMVNDNNPHWKFITRLADETIQSDPSVKPPKWTGLPAELVKIAMLARATEDTGTKIDDSLKKKISDRLKKAEQNTEQEMGKLDPQMQRIAQQRATRAKIFADYSKAIALTIPIAGTGDTPFRMMSDIFSGQAALAEDKSPFNQAYSQALALKNAMKEDDYGDAEFLWYVLAGPLNYLINFGTQKASCSLQDKWEGEVVAKVDGVPREKVLKSLFDKTEGLVTKYRETTAKPFIADTKLGYAPRKAYENTPFETSIPFKPEFLKFLNSSQTAPVEFQTDHTVTITTVPIDVNQDATLKPQGNILSLQCSDGTALLQNYNYPTSKSFVWSPENCADTTLKIKFPDFTLTKAYKGRTGFATFLTEFSSGAKTFKISDFPENKAGLMKAGIKWIKVRYTIENAQPIISGLSKSSKKAPSVASDCAFK
ncbi:MAG: type VI secretion protein IcmF/TssM N-terminal domain-containing protein [Syntrophorhabdus sp.]